MSSKTHQVENPEFWHSREWDGDFFKAVVKKIQNLHVLQVCNRWRQLCDLVVAEGQPCDVLHPPQLRHVGLQWDQRLVREVQFSILDPCRLLQGLLDDLGGHDDTPWSELEPRWPNPKSACCPGVAYDERQPREQKRVPPTHTHRPTL